MTELKSIKTRKKKYWMDSLVRVEDRGENEIVEV